MNTERFIYNLNYPVNEQESCELEVRSLFQFDLKEKVFFENREIHPSVSPFLRNRLEIIFQASTFSEILKSIIVAKFAAPDFMVKYVDLEKDERRFKKRREYCKAIGFMIKGFPDFIEPKNIFGITFYQGIWYFGRLAERSSEWRTHNRKPNAYSSSIDLNTAKVLINIAGCGETSKRLIDPCCGVGTVLLEGAWAGYEITGWEINAKVAESARENLKHFNYDVPVFTGDIQDIEDHFDASIIDLPYGNFSPTDEENQLKIIRNAKRISSRIVLVSSEDVREELIKENLKIIDHCKIGKKTKGPFMRSIWVCEVNK